MKQPRLIAMTFAALAALPLFVQGCAASMEGPAPKKEEAPVADDALDEAGRLAPQCVRWNCYSCPDDGKEYCRQGAIAIGVCDSQCVAACYHSDSYCTGPD